MAITALVMGDTHVGSCTGLLGPSYWQEQIKIQQSLFWGWYMEVLQENGPFDLLLGLGDAVDGEGKKGSLGTILTDTLEQCEAAEEVYSAPGVKGDNVFLVRGTPFHSSGTYEYEDPLAAALGASIEDEQYINISGLKVKLRHTTGRSDTAYGQGTPLFRDSVRDLVDSFIDKTDSADLFLAGHVHYHARVDVGIRSAISNPCLSLPGNVFGRKCRAMYYHVGLGKLTVRSRTDWVYRPILFPMHVVVKKEYVNVGTY